MTAKNDAKLHHRHLSSVILGAANEHKRRAGDAERSAQKIKEHLSLPLGKNDPMGLKRAYADTVRMARVQRLMYDALMRAKLAHDTSEPYVPSDDDWTALDERGPA